MTQPRLDLSWTGTHHLPPGLLRRTIRSIARRVDPTRRGDPHARPLRASLARWHRVPENWVVVGAGSAPILECLVRRFGRPSVVELVPTFHLVRGVCAREGIAHRSLPLRRSKDAERVLLPAMSRKRLGALVMACPRTPFGWDVPPKVRQVRPAFESIVIRDEAYADFARLRIRRGALADGRTIVVRTFSKAWGLSNLRIGYAVSPLMHDPKVQSFLLPYRVGELAYLTAKALLGQASQVQDSINRMRRQRRRLVASLRRLKDGYVHPSVANFLCLEHPKAAGLSVAFERAGLKVARLRILPGYDSAWPDGIRLSVPGRTATDRARRVIDRWAALQATPGGQR